VEAPVSEPCPTILVTSTEILRHLHSCWANGVLVDDIRILGSPDRVWKGHVLGFPNQEVTALYYCPKVLNNTFTYESSFSEGHYEIGNAAAGIDNIPEARISVAIPHVELPVPPFYIGSNADSRPTRISAVVEVFPERYEELADVQAFLSFHRLAISNALEGYAVGDRFHRAQLAKFIRVANRSKVRAGLRLPAAVYDGERRVPLGVFLDRPLKARDRTLYEATLYASNSIASLARGSQLVRRVVWDEGGDVRCAECLLGAVVSRGIEQPM